VLEEIDNNNLSLVTAITNNSGMFAFKLSDDFVNSYKGKTVAFGYKDAGGNSVGEITFLRTYSRLKKDGTKETWVGVCERVINGMYSIQKDHCKSQRLPWNDARAQASAKEAFDRLFNLKWTPPGRGLWVMGTDIVNVQKNSAALQNCAFVSTLEMNKFNPAKPFAFLMEASMLGVGVGFDDKGADKDFIIYEPKEKVIIAIPDTREGWVESVAMVLNSYLKENQPSYEFDYSQIRPLGAQIKTFGGTASGPEPLIKLHAHIHKLFLGRAGEKLTRIDIADVGNLIGVCVVSGNVRRSAELLIGRLDDNNFLDLKNKDIFPERNSYDPVAPGWGWMSNNSVETVVGSDLSGIIDGIALNGEPGVIWMDLARKYGRLADPPNNKDWRVAGFNPSLITGTKVYTTEGIRNIESLEGKSFVVKNLDGKLSEAKCWKSGTNVSVHTVNLAGGHSYGATKEHKWPVWNGEAWVKKSTLELQHGDLLPNLVQGSMFPDGTRGTYDEGFLIGWNLGDGWQTDRKDGRRQYGFIVSDNDRKSGIHKKLVSTLTSLGVSTEMDTKEEINVSHHGIRDLFDSFSVQHKTIGLPKEVWESDVSDEFRKGLIDALYSSDGTVDTSRICFSQASKIMVDELSSLLGFFGIKTNKGTITRPRSEAFPNSYADDGSTFTRHVLHIGSIDNIKNFSKLFTLSHKDKQDKINEICSRKHFTSDKTNYIEVVSITDGGTADVWDVSVFDDTHAFQIDHCITGNCAEQSLESYECCTLVETYLNRHDSLEDYKRTLKFAYLYAKTVTLLPTHWEETNAIMQRNRRIGASMSGVANFADRVGIPILKEWMDQGYKTIQRYDNIYSEWLGIRESVKMTTIKPSGTVSILAGESPGVHWTPGGKYFNRTIRFSNDDPMLPLFRMANYKVEPASESPDTTSVVYFPIKSQASRAEKDVTIFEKMSLAATAQRYWSDNSVSVTISFNAETESQHVGTVLHMYDGQLKTVSFLPSGNDTYPQMPYTQISEEEYIEATKTLFAIDLTGVYAGMAADAIGENYCTTDSCEVKFVKENAK